MISKEKLLILNSISKKLWGLTFKENCPDSKRFIYF